jgi:hypothetical protein
LSAAESFSETFMRTTELFRSCANEHVAAAAMACIGGKLHKRVADAARHAGLSSGAYVARLVADYDRKASPMRRKHLEKGMGCDPMPILAGLRHVVESALEGEWDVAAPKPDVSERTEIHWSCDSIAALRQGRAPKVLYS